MRRRDRMMGPGTGLKPVLGLLLATDLMIDRPAETALSPKTL